MMSSEDSRREPVSGKPQFDEAAVIAAAIGSFLASRLCGRFDQRPDGGDGLVALEPLSAIPRQGRPVSGSPRRLHGRVLRRMNAAKADTARGRLEALLRAYLAGRILSARRLPDCAKLCRNLRTIRGGTRPLRWQARDASVKFWPSCLRDGVAAGELAEDADIDAMAWHYLGVLHAVLNFPQAGADAEHDRSYDRGRDVGVAYRKPATGGQRAASKIGPPFPASLSAAQSP